PKPSRPRAQTSVWMRYVLGGADVGGNSKVFSLVRGRNGLQRNVPALAGAEEKARGGIFAFPKSALEQNGLPSGRIAHAPAKQAAGQFDSQGQAIAAGRAIVGHERGTILPRRHQVSLTQFQHSIREGQGVIGRAYRSQVTSSSQRHL